MFVVHPAGASDDDATTDMASAASTAASKNQKSNALLQQMLQKTLGIDAETAGYYLLAADFDPRAAITAFKEDQRWDAKVRHLKRSLCGKKYGKCK